ncbi:hypothetical protein JCM8547_006987 [Rhodosporidiobolus lusitaniae]
MAESKKIKSGELDRTLPSSSIKASALGLDWNAFYPEELARLKEDHPSWKHKQLQKRAGANFQELKKSTAEKQEKQKVVREGK